jgi:hypothetical protein
VKQINKVCIIFLNKNSWIYLIFYNSENNI